MTTKAASVTVQDTFTAPLYLHPGARCSISIFGAFTADITLQRKLDGTNWRDVETWSLPIETTYIADQTQNVRIGVKTGDYTTGTVEALIGTD